MKNLERQNQFAKDLAEANKQTEIEMAYEKRQGELNPHLEIKEYWLAGGQIPYYQNWGGGL